MKDSLPQNLINLANACPYPLYIVGGRVRDFLAGLSAEKPDNDICAPASAEDFTVRAQRTGFTVDAVYKNTGTVKLRYGADEYEFTSFRSDEYVRGKHVPENVYFTNDISLDARRRDFRCNAVYYDISAGQFVDPLGGTEDIKAKKLETVADANKVFGEDGLRLMRLARIAAQTGFVSSEGCFCGAAKNAALLSDISPERVYAELDGILHADLKYGNSGGQYDGLEILQKTGVLGYILPELSAGDGMKQPPRYHDHDVLDHSLRCVKYAHPIIRLAALLHDVGKPYRMQHFGNYHTHEICGAEIARDICLRFRVSSKLTESVCKLVALHMYDLDCAARESKVRRFIIRNYGCLNELLLLKQADYSACKDDLSVAPSVEKINSIVTKMREDGAPFTLKELAVNGEDVIGAGVKKELTGKVLNRLLEDCAVGLVKNDRANLLNYALKVANSL